eukprot:30894_1
MKITSETSIVLHHLLQKDNAIATYLNFESMLERDQWLSHLESLSVSHSSFDEVNHHLFDASITKKVMHRKLQISNQHIGPKIINQQIDEHMIEQHIVDETTYKVLLTGTPQSGKKAILQELDAKFGFYHFNTEFYRRKIREITLKSMLILLNKSRDSDEKLQFDAAALDAMQMITELDTYLISPKLGEAIALLSHLYQDKYELVNNTNYFVKQAERIYSDDFEPTSEDVLHVTIQKDQLVERI